MEEDEEGVSDEDRATQEQLESQYDQQGGFYPKAPARESVFKFFRYLIDLKDSSKVGNITKDELGKPEISVRGLQSVAQYAAFEGLEDVENYIQKEAEITLATSLSKKGFMPQLFVTQIKQEKKGLQNIEKKGWLNKKKVAE